MVVEVEVILLFWNLNQTMNAKLCAQGLAHGKVSVHINHHFYCFFKKDSEILLQPRYIQILVSTDSHHFINQDTRD